MAKVETDKLRTTTQPCLLHTRHMPETHVNHRHHIWPLGEGGPDTEDNVVAVCATGHYNIHDLLAHFKMLRGYVPYSVLKRYSMEERKYAKLGWERIQRKSM